MYCNDIPLISPTPDSIESGDVCDRNCACKNDACGRASADSDAILECCNNEKDL